MMMKWNRNAFLSWLDYAVLPKLGAIIMSAVFLFLILMFGAPVLAFVLGILYQIKLGIVTCFNAVGTVLDAISNITNF